MITCCMCMWRTHRKHQNHLKKATYTPEKQERPEQNQYIDFKQNLQLTHNKQFQLKEKYTLATVQGFSCKKCIFISVAY